MDIEYLIYFNKIAETGNISQAARKLSLSQPALSRILKNIETTLGTPLFDRNGRAISLNEYGKTFYDYSDRLFLCGTRHVLKFHTLILSILILQLYIQPN